MIVIGDTSGLLAAFDADDREHVACTRAVAGASLLVISPLVLAELDYLLAAAVGERAAIGISTAITHRVRDGRFEIAHVTAELIAAANTVRASYLALRLGLTDAVNVVLAAQYHTHTVLTLDRRHFRAVRPLDAPEAFQLWPDDLADSAAMADFR